MERKSELKVVGGKLIRVRCIVEDNVLRKVKITGDFFMHPEEKVDDLERRLTGVNVHNINSVVEDYFKQTKVTVLGATPSDFARAIQNATI